jgi:hypothetical protein
MAYRTTPEKVAAIVETDEDDDLEPFIEAANSLVNDVCLNSSYTESKLTMIEKWLAAHFYCVFRPRSQQEVTSKIQDTYEGKVDLRLQVTKYGQQVLILDTAGNLAGLNNSAGKILKVPASLNWLGVTDQEKLL